MKAIDPDREGDAEPRLDEVFREWRGTAARGIKAPDDDVCALFAQALGGVGQERDPDFGLTPLLSETHAVLDRLASRQNPGGP